MNHSRAALLLDYLLKELDSWRNLSYISDSKHATNDRIENFKVELKFLKTFLVYVQKWDGGAQLGSLVHDIEAGFKSSKRDFRAASKKGIERSREHLLIAISKLQEKLMLWRLQIKAAYDYVESSFSFESHSDSHSPLSNYDLWMSFCGSLEQNLLDLLRWKGKLPADVIPQLETANMMLGTLRYFLQGLIQDLGLQQSNFRYVLSHFGVVLVRAAHLFYLLWVDMDSLDEKMTIMLSDLLKKFKPSTPQVIEACLDALTVSSKATESKTKRVGRFFFPEKYQFEILNRGLGQHYESMNKMPTDLVKSFMPNTVIEECLDAFRPSYKALDFTTQLDLFCRFLFFEKYQVESLNKGLGQLVLFVFHSHIMYKGGPVRLLLIDIVAAFSGLGSYLCNKHETTRDRPKEIDPALNRLLQKIMLLVMEAFLVNLNIVYLKLMPAEKHHFDCIEHGLAFFQNFLGDNMINLDPIWIYIEHVVSNDRAVSDNAHNFSTLDEKSLRDISGQLVIIRILKMEIILEELLNRYSLPNVENQIKTLREQLALVRTFLMVEHGENEELTLTHVQPVLSHAASTFYSLRWNEITEDTLRKFSPLLPELLEKINVVSAEMKDMYLRVRSSLPSHFPKAEGFGFMDFLLGDLKELLNSKDVSIAKVKHQIRVVHGGMELLRSFLKYMGDEHNEDSDLKILVSHIVDLAFQVEYIADSFAREGVVLWYHVVWLSDVMEGIKLTTVQASEISKKMHGISIHNIHQSVRKVISPTKISQIDELVVDLVDENELMINRLTRGSLQLDVVSIVGMAGLGKTTLARKVYNSPSVTYHFHVRAWCCVSQAYQKRKLLLEILGDIVELTDNILEMSDGDLDIELYRCLKGKRYLIVMDDIWSIEAWNELERSFPNDENGSRILITSRLHDVVAKTKADCIPHSLRLLSSDESWELLRRKLFKRDDCPDELVDLGKQIARSCKGLPLALVAVSGLLQRTDMKLDWWKEVAESLSSLIANDPETRCMDILELSYKHLPNHLKPCFLYLGAFVEDKEIPVRKLIWLWVAEGFIQNTGLESLEDVAAEYLADLIGSSLVMSSKRRSNGGVKTCRVHDMLRKLCLQLCKEESFLEQVTGCDEVFASFPEDLDYGVHPSYSQPTNPVTYHKRRLSIHSKRNHFVMVSPSGPHVHSLLHFAISDSRPHCPYNISFIAKNFKRLRVLDLECINMGESFSSGIEVLVRLRYLALSGDVDRIPDSIANFRSLQTLLLKGLKGIVLLPATIWSMVKLRHLHVNNGAAFSLPGAEMEVSSQLDNLVSLSSLVLSGGQDAEKILRRLPKLQKLKCIFSESPENVENCNQFPVLDFLKDLESLKVLYSGRKFHPRKFHFPLMIRKLTLSNFRLPWDCISEIGKLPNLEVLKLLSRAFEGEIWDMKDGEFMKLEFLKLDTLNIAQWNASGDNLPNLQHLVLRSCRQLEEIPSDFGDIPTLEIIEVQMCRCSVEESVKNLKQEQLDMGNEELKILINRSDWDI